MNNNFNDDFEMLDENGLNNVNAQVNGNVIQNNQVLSRSNWNVGTPVNNNGNNQMTSNQGQKSKFFNESMFADDPSVPVNNNQNVPMNNNQGVPMNNNQGIPVNNQNFSVNNMNDNLQNNNMNGNFSNNQIPVNNMPNGNSGEWFNNQPLSPSSLGVSNINMAEQPRDVEDDNKFLNYSTEVMNQMPNNNYSQPVNGIGRMFEENNSGNGIDDKKAVRYFIGDNYGKISTSPFNFGVLIFGYTYYFYRKMFILGIVIFLIEFLLMSKVNFIVYGVFRVILALFTNNIYSFCALSKTRNIIKKNPDLNENDLYMLCSEKGGTSIIFAIIFSIISGIIVTVLSTVLFGISILTVIKNSISFDFGSKPIINSTENIPFDVNTVFVSSYSELNDEIFVNVPSNFSRSGNDYIFKYNIDNNKDFNYCTFSLQKVPSFKESKDLALKMQKFYSNSSSEISNVKTSNINGIIWYNFYYDNSYGTNYVRTSKINDKIYVTSYLKGADSIEGVCDGYYNSIINSIKEK